MQDVVPLVKKRAVGIFSFFSANRCQNFISFNKVLLFTSIGAEEAIQAYLVILNW
jgi:hypothetical protein